MARMAIIVINHNSGEALRNCLNVLPADPEMPVVVVDSASSDGSPEMVAREFPRVHCISLRNNAGYGGAANVGVRATDTEYVLILNSDTVVSREAAAALIGHLDRHPEAGIVGPRLVGTNGDLQYSCRRFPGTLAWMVDNHAVGRTVSSLLPGLSRLLLRTWPHDTERSVPWIVGAALAMRRNAFDSVGGFSDSYFMYCEDIDLCYRVRAAGWTVRFTPASVVVHVGGASTSAYPARMQAELENSMCRFYSEHYSGLRRRLLIALTRAGAPYRKYGFR